MSNDIDKSVNRLNAAETIRRQAIALQKHISEALAGLQTLSGSEDIQISHALTMAGTYGKSGVTCDWSHVSVAGKEPAR